MHLGYKGRVFSGPQVVGTGLWLFRGENMFV